jgi:hypothetical protein
VPCGIVARIRITNEGENKGLLLRGGGGVRSCVMPAPQFVRLLDRAFTKQELAVLMENSEFAKSYDKMSSVADSDAVVLMGGRLMKERWFAIELATRKNIGKT